MIDASSTLREVAFEVCTAYAQIGEQIVLTGGSAATVYAPDAYQSQDIDFVFEFWTTNISSQPLINLGFSQDRQQWRHSSSHFTVDFIRGPLMVGEDQIESWQTLREGAKVLHILTPTDCLRDRLAWFIAPMRPDFSALEQALSVAAKLGTEVDMTLVEDWSRRENSHDRFLMFLERLNERKS